VKGADQLDHIVTTRQRSLCNALQGTREDAKEHVLVVPSLYREFPAREAWKLGDLAILRRNRTDDLEAYWQEEKDSLNFSCLPNLILCKRGSYRHAKEKASEQAASEEAAHAERGFHQIAARIRRATENK
jgi:hypothetical protein